jgi:hypothetical protein
MARRFEVAETLVEQASDPAAHGWHRVRWAVDGRERCKSSSATKALADAFLSTLKLVDPDFAPDDSGNSTRLEVMHQPGRPAGG